MDETSAERVSQKMIAVLSRLLLISFVLLLGSCQDRKASEGEKFDESLPYGVWSTRAGQVVLITRDGGYVYCSRSSCFTGQAKFEGRIGVKLVGFWGSPVAAAMFLASPPSGAKSAAALDLDFTERGMGADLRNDICDARPCVTVGQTDFDEYIFVKTESW